MQYYLPKLICVWLSAFEGFGKTFWQDTGYNSAVPMLFCFALLFVVVVVVVFSLVVLVLGIEPRA